MTGDEPVFSSFLGADYERLPAQVQALHDVGGPRRWSGRASVVRGRTPWARLIAVIFGFPPAADDVAVTVAMTPRDGGEIWERAFGHNRFRSFLKVRAGRMTERFGPFTFTLNLHVAEGQLHFPVTAGRLGPVPLPRCVSPISIAHEYEDAGRFHFDVALYAPLTAALMVHYQGWLEPDG